MSTRTRTGSATGWNWLLLAAVCAVAASTGAGAAEPARPDPQQDDPARESQDIREIAGTYWSQGPFIGPEPRGGWSDDGMNDQIPVIPRARREASWPTHGTRYQEDAEGVRWSYDPHGGWLPEPEDPGQDVVSEHEGISGGDS